ncbi:allene oxide synthase-lipoxygenase protein-like [Mytilus californianus]|uniref:allene oxide synthase-lipoxygenase protein-like n=1 Tax=Mytilus californianus TaxID=6549 RepID=UPI0022454EEF|nr:allene oxide synthase-lipoxygenase protein-like [Mytilus californianus]
MMTVDEIRLNKLMSEGIVEMISQDRLFVTNLNMTDGLGIPSPVVLFQQTTHSGLVPVAIQLNQPKGKSNETNPVFYPDDDTNVWKLAKMWCNLADSSIHLGIVHLGLTHLLMEGVNISMHRNLSSRHPVYKLLAPHFHYTLAINELARLDLLGPGEYVDRIIKIKSAGVLIELGEKLEVWRLDIDGTLPADLRKRGLLSPDENGNEKVNLPGFFYAEDGLRLYYAIREYVDEYVRYYYCGEDDNETKQRLIDDAEIQAFCKELQKPRAFVDGGIGIKGVPSTNDKFETIDQLTDTITSIIYTCSVMHAATNYPMYDEYGFPPNYSTMLHKEPPSDAKALTDQDVLDSLPSVAETFDMMTIFTRLSQETTKPLGEFEVQYIEDEGAVKILDKFRSKLAKIGMDIEKRNEKIKEENERRKADNEIVYQRPYTILLPKNVPNSIAI